MKILYLECNMGAAGDMIMGALLELVENRSEFINKMNNLNIPGIRVLDEKSIKCGIEGTHMNVEVDGDIENSHDCNDSAHNHSHIHNGKHLHEEHFHGHSHHHSDLGSVIRIIDNMCIPDKVKKDVANIYEIIAGAESRVHGKPVAEVHFHEVGMMDAIVDITGCCLLMNELAPDKVIVSPIKTGFGHVHCEHGVMPVPAPATALILRGIPNSSGEIEGELCTPTGAAVLKYFADEYSYQPEMITEKIGYGMGNKDYEAANCVRAVLGATLEGAEKIFEICCNIDDMTPEEIGYASEILLSNNVLDVYTTPIGMKKSRSGIKLTVLCGFDDKEKVLNLVFKHTSTLGVRYHLCDRAVLERYIYTEDTELGELRIKKASGFGVERQKYEFDDLKKIAEDTGSSIYEVKKRLEQ